MMVPFPISYVLHISLKNKFSIYNITKREYEIIELIISGKSNKDISETCFISLPTVKSHIKNIFQKMNINSRFEMISLLIK